MFGLGQGSLLQSWLQNYRQGWLVCGAAKLNTSVGSMGFREIPTKNKRGCEDGSWVKSKQKQGVCGVGTFETGKERCCVG